MIGLAPLWGLLGFTLAAGVVMGLLSERISNREISPSALCCRWHSASGSLFCMTTRRFATQATALLFGNVLAVDRQIKQDD